MAAQPSGSIDLLLFLEALVLSVWSFIPFNDLSMDSECVLLMLGVV